MPQYYAESQAVKELDDFDDDVFMLWATIERFRRIYPYAEVDFSVFVDEDERERVLRRRYTYWTNIEYTGKE